MKLSTKLFLLLLLALLLTGLVVIAFLVPTYVWHILGILVMAMVLSVVVMLVLGLTGAFNNRGPIQ